MAEGGCNVCNADLRRAAAERRPVVFDLENENCRVCGARPRIRAMAYALDVRGAEICRQLGIYGRARGLFAAADRAEQMLLAPFVASVTTCSLFGSYGPDHVVCDVTDLAPFADKSFDLFEACCMLDFVPELERAIGNISRVLAERAAFFIHFSDSRLLAGTQPPQVARYRTNFSASYYPKDYSQPVVKVGRAWFAKEWERHGFSLEQIAWQDSGHPKPLTWWLGWRGPP